MRIDVQMFLDQLSRENDFDDFFEEELDLSCLKRSSPYMSASNEISDKNSQEISCA